jgi:hypothetical protein
VPGLGAHTAGAYPCPDTYDMNLAKTISQSPGVLSCKMGTEIPAFSNSQGSCKDKTK